MAYIIGSARISEDNTINGVPGDQKQTTSGNDYVGEVSLQNFYVHRLGWYVLRFKDRAQGVKMANAIIRYCNDSNVGYGQNTRLGIMDYDGSEPCNADCGTLMRRGFKDATGVDPGEFYTANERAILLRTGLLEDLGKYYSGMKLMSGDILVTCTKGHTVCVTEGETEVTPTPAKSTITYASHLHGGGWLGEINGYNEVNGDGYSGLYGKPIDCIMMKINGGTIYYRVHSSVSNKWYSEISGYDKNDFYHGYAGVGGKDIDAISIRTEGVSGTVKYRVHTLNGSWLPWVTGYDIDDNSNGYAGNLGQKIDGIQITFIEGSEPVPTPTPIRNYQPTYCSHVKNGSWLGEITGYNNENGNGYSGLYGKPIDCVMVKINDANVTYRAHSCDTGKWYGHVTGYDKNYGANGYAGMMGKAMDAIMIKADGINGTLKYRVHTVNGRWLSWVTGYNENDVANGYAGNIGQKIDGIQIAIE